MIEFHYELKRSNRKSISVEISREAKIIVRAPLKMEREKIDAFLNSKSEWIEKHLAKMQGDLAQIPDKLTQKEKSDLKKQARRLIAERTEYFAKRMDVEYKKISIRFQTTRFGSCSAKKNLNFNALIVLMPNEIADYVIVHELAHLKEMNHSKSFWNEVERIIPDYKARRKWLHENGIKFIQRI